MSAQISYITSKADGRKLMLRHWPLENAIAQAQLVHGIAEHSGRYEHVAEALNATGFDVFAHDHRSFGGSIQDDKPEFSIYGHFADQDGWRKALADILQVKEQFTASKPCVLLAHSMGSFMAQSLMQKSDFPYEAVALSGTKGPTTLKDRAAKILAAVEVLRKGARNASPLADKLMEREFNGPFKPTQTAFDWICSDSSVVQAYCDDPLCGQPFTTQLAKDLIDGFTDIFKSGYKDLCRDIPIYLFAGAQDPVSDMSKGVRNLSEYLKNREFSKVETQIYYDMRHEVLNEIGNDRVISDFIHWVNKVTA